LTFPTVQSEFKRVIERIAAKLEPSHSMEMSEVLSRVMRTKKSGKALQDLLDSTRHRARRFSEK
jgi:hypothetical protein